MRRQTPEATLNLAPAPARLTGVSGRGSVADEEGDAMQDRNVRVLKRGEMVTGCGLRGEVRIGRLFGVRGNSAVIEDDRGRLWYATTIKGWPEEVRRETP